MKEFNLNPENLSTSASKKLKVLVSAYACEPDKGSEPGVGWHWAKQIARFHEVWVITRANNRDAIERELQKNPDAGLHFIYYDVPKWLSFWKKKERGLYLYYWLWQIGAYLVAKEINKREPFDLVHHLTFGNLWLPTFMSLLPIPFVWGPIGGGEHVPKPFRKDYTLKARIQELVRDIILASLKVNPLFLYPCKKARLVIVRTQETLDRIPQPYWFKTVKIIETGVNETDIPVKSESVHHDFIQIISVGRLIHLKGFDLALKAFSKVTREFSDSKMIIIGNGPDRKRLQKICQEENILNMVSFWGHLHREKVLQLMSESSIFLFPSLKEGGAWVLFESMLLGLPVVCLDIAGPAEIVNNECGIKVKPITPEQTVKDLSDAILKLTKEPGLRKAMGKAGKKRAEEVYNWGKKGEMIKKLYAECVEYV